MLYLLYKLLHLGEGPGRGTDEAFAAAQGVASIVSLDTAVGLGRKLGVGTHCGKYRKYSGRRKSSG